MKLISKNRTGLLICTALVPVMLAPTTAVAQASSDENKGGLEEIVVTAQKREQSLQDVPISVTAISQASLESNRIVNVADLSGMAPNVTVRPAAGGTGIASFTIRGVNSYGVAPGSDKEVSINLDGVYISSSRGSIFDLADIQRIEVLRGPQGTLFGRNATAGAVSIITRDPAGKFGATQTVTVGNFDQLRLRTTIDLPQIGPFSAYVSYVHNERRGETRNTNAGVVWDKTGPDGFGKIASPEWLGSHNSEMFFAAVKFAPTDTFRMTYKFDWSGDNYTPEGNTAINWDPTNALLNSLITNQVGGTVKGVDAGGIPLATVALPVPVGTFIKPGTVPTFAVDGKRTGLASNAWTVPGYQRNVGHNLTAELNLTDHLTVKNIAAFRSSYLFGTSDLAGLGGMVVTPAMADAYYLAYKDSPLATPTQNYQARTQYYYSVGKRFLDYGTSRLYTNKQWSDEIQLNYTHKLFNITAGGIYFHSKEREGGPETMFSSRNNYVGIPDDTGLLPQGNEAKFLTTVTSTAVFGQLEVHVLPTLDLVGGIRFTHDKKSGQSFIGGKWNPASPGDRTAGFMSYTTTTTPGTTKNPFTGATVPILIPAEANSFLYDDKETSYSFGINYKPTDDILLYGKYSKSYVSGGGLAGVLTWKPEIAKSWEAGVKSTLLDGKLRINLSAFTVSYDNLQTANGGGAFAFDPALSALSNIPVLIISNEARVRAKGFELEVTAAPVAGVNLGGNMGYTDMGFQGNPGVLTLLAVGLCSTEYFIAADHGLQCSKDNADKYKPTFVPPWTGNLWAQYTTGPVFMGGKMSFRLDGTYRAKQNLTANGTTPLTGAFASVRAIPKAWILNGRIALQDVEIGAVKTTLAVWARNLTDVDSIQYTGGITGSASASFTPARTIGADLTVKF